MTVCFSHLRNVAIHLVAALAFEQAVASPQEISVASPDKELVLLLQLRDGVPYYAIHKAGEPLISPSRMGFQLVDAPALDGNFTIERMARSSKEESWVQPWGQKREIRCAYNELRVSLRQRDELARRLIIVFRVFDDGVGFRYEWPEQPNLTALNISRECTEFAFAEECSVWWIPAFQRTYTEYLYHNTMLGEVPTVHTPVTLERADGVCLSIHEAALTDFASMTLTGNGGLTLKTELVPWSDGVKVRATTPHQSPWRTIQIGDSPADLITSYLILNLNAPSKLEDTGWIKPGKYAGIWWELHLGRSTWASGERHGANNANVMRMLDFAAENCCDGVLVEGWNLGWDGDWIANGERFDFTRSYRDFDLDLLTKYAKSKGVYLIGHHETGAAVTNYECQLEEALSLYERLGVRAVKTGYVNFGRGVKRIDDEGQEHKEWLDSQFMVRHHRRVVEEAAKHRLMLDVHEPIKPTGLERTYPNLMTQEGARGQEYDAWSEDGGNPPDHTTILPFTRLLAGPMDFTPGIFDLNYEEYRPKNRVNTTLIKQLALYVILYSPLQMLPDLPENYAAYSDAFRFVREVPTDWEDTRVLNGKIGDYVTIVRKERNGEDWFLGSITDEHPRALEVPLGFLDAERPYLAEIYRDADEADWQTNPASYVIESRHVNSETVLELHLAPGGGQAIRFRAVQSAPARNATNQLRTSTGS